LPTSGGVDGELLLVAALACQPGDRLIDLSSKIPRGVRSMAFVVSLEPFYTQFYIYHAGFPDSVQQCCPGKPTAVLRNQLWLDDFASGKVNRK
jgi:hypothetical protein